jgi:hypothetical protein
MGITHSNEENQSEYDPDQGYVPKKIREVDTHYHENPYQYVVGDGKLLKFCTKTWSFEETLLDSSIKIGDSCAVVMKANRRGFYVTGGNDDFKQWYTGYYYFETRDLSMPLVLPDLPYPV